MDEDHEVTIGQEFAAAQAAEPRRLRANSGRASPLPPGRYDPWLGQLRLFDIVPLPLDSALTSYVRAAGRLTAGQRAQRRDATSLDDAYTLLAFARRSAVFAMRSGDAALVLDGLRACAAANSSRVDERDVLVALALLRHAAGRCHDAAALLRAAGADAEPALRQLIDWFLAQPAAERDLRDAWGYVEADGPDGVGLLRWGFASWLPTVDLTSAGLRVAASLDGRDYAVDDPELASKLPAIWLSATGDPALEPILAAARAAVVIHARLRPQMTPDHDSQQLTAWLVELGDKSAAARLLELSHTPRAGHSLLGLADGPLFVLVVARSVVRGVAAFEHGTSLGRFEPGIRDALRA